MIVILLPIKDEHDTIQQTVAKLLTWCKINLEQDYCIYIVDDSGKDDFKMAPHDKVALIQNFRERGKGSALKTGFEVANKDKEFNPTDIFIFMDGDGQIEPQAIKTFLNMFDFYSADVVIGNKRHLYSITDYGYIRSFVSRGYNFLVRLMFNIDFKDTQCGIKAFKKYALDEVIHKISTKGYAFDVELIVALRALKYRIVDAPVKVTKQINIGSVNLINIFTTFIDTVKIFNKKRKMFYRG